MFTYWLTWFFFYFCWLLLSIPDRNHPITNSLPVNMWGLHGSDVTILKILVVFSCHSSPILWYPSIVHTEKYFRSLHGDVWLMFPRPRKTHGTKIKPHSNPDISPRSWRILDEDRVPSKWKTTNRTGGVLFVGPDMGGLSRLSHEDFYHRHNLVVMTSVMITSQTTTDSNTSGELWIHGWYGVTGMYVIPRCLVRLTSWMHRWRVLYMYWQNPRAHGSGRVFTDSAAPTSAGVFSGKSWPTSNRSGIAMPCADVKLDA